MRLPALWSAALALACVLGISSAAAKDTHATPPQASAYCKGPVLSYTLGPKKDVDALYPVIQTALQSASDHSMAVASNIQLYLQNSLLRDRISDTCNLQVQPLGAQGYQVSFQSANPLAAQYGATQTAWLQRGALALQGIAACQQGKKGACWEPSDVQGSSCAGPWQFYLPLGLPMLSQKMVMLLHYPPYVAMQQADYLNNATLRRWQRLLTTVGVAEADWTLYTSTVDIFPIAAPGSGETGCFSTANAVQYFGGSGSGYIPHMLEGLVAAGGGAGGTATRPVIIFGSEAIGYWNASYPQNPTAVLKAGQAALDPAAPTRLTPFMGANHPIATVYQKSEADITKFTAQDLATACFAKRMGDQLGADAVAVAAACQAEYQQPAAASPAAAQLCAVAVVDHSPQFAQWSVATAQAWCQQHQNQYWPLPDYYGKP